MLRLLGDEMAFHEGAGRVVPPTGRTVTIRWAGVARLADGQVVSLHGYYDQLAFLAQLGLVPQPA